MNEVGDDLTRRDFRSVTDYARQWCGTEDAGLAPSVGKTSCLLSSNPDQCMYKHDTVVGAVTVQEA